MYCAAHSHRVAAVVAGFGLVGTCLAFPSTGMALERSQPGTLEAAAQGAFQHAPLQFVPNEGQLDDGVAFKVRGSGHEIFFTPEQIAFVRPLAEADAGETGVPAAAIVLEFEGANLDPEVEGIHPLPGQQSFYRGESSHWREKVPTYGGVAYRNLYPGIDLIYSGEEGALKRDFVVAPGADPRQLRLRYEGAGRVTVREDGALVLLAAGGELVEAAPVVYQDVKGRRVLVDSAYRLHNDGSVGFALGAYDPRLPLVIDPVLAYSSFFGGSGNETITDLDVMTGKSSFVAVGYTTSTSATFPLVNPIDGTLTSGTEAFVTFYDPAQPENMFTTYLGNGAVAYGGAAAHAVKVTDDGVIYLAGQAGTGFPITMGPSFSGSTDAFVAMIKENTLAVSRYVGTSYFEAAYDLALDPADGSVYIGGRIEGSGLVSSSPFDATFNGSTDGFVYKLNADFTSAWGTYLGGGSMDEVSSMDIDALGLVVAGYAQNNVAQPFPTSPGTPAHGGGDDGFVVQLRFNGTLSSSQFLGGSGSDEIYDIVLDDSSHVFVVGTTSSANFPVQNPMDGTLNNTDAFLVRYYRDLPLSKQYATFLGGSGYEYGYALRWSPTYDVLGVLGWTSSTNFPTESPIQGSLAASGYGDAFVSVVPTDLSQLIFSTYLGGSQQELGASGLANIGAMGGLDWSDEGALCVGGDTASSNFPVTGSALDSSYNGGLDAFITVYEEVAKY